MITRDWLLAQLKQRGIEPVRLTTDRGCPGALFEVRDEKGKIRLIGVYVTEPSRYEIDTEST